MPFVDDILIEHAEEAATLWLLRHTFARRPQVRLDDLAEHDERIEAHLDGLRLAGPVGWRIAEQAAAQAPGSASAFVLGALACGDDALEARRAILAEHVLAEPDVIAGVAAGVAWSPAPSTTGVSVPWWRSEAALLRQAALAIDLALVHDPGPALASACGDADPGLRARALRAVGGLGRLDLVERCRRALADQDPACRDAALWSLALCGQEVAGALRGLAGRLDADSALVDLAARRLPRAQVMEWLKTDAKRPELLGRAVHLAGAHGDVLVMPWLLMQLGIPVVARQAGAAFAHLTGVDLEAAGLTTAAPADFRAGPTDDPADDEVAPDPAEGLPWPDATQVTAWWSRHAESIPAGVRHLLGRPLSDAHLAAVLRSGTQPQRAAAAVELALLRPGRPLFDVLAPAGRQAAALAATDVAHASS